MSEHEANTRGPVVAIGASAGGLEQISTLLGLLPDNTGAAFVVMQHLSAARKSQLPELLSRTTTLPVIVIEHDMALEPDRVHVMPENCALGIKNGRLQLLPKKEETTPTVIDGFMRALAEERTEKAIGIILSGSGNDGALGLKAIKLHGGLSMVQDPDTAEHLDGFVAHLEEGVVAARLGAAHERRGIGRARVYGGERFQNDGFRELELDEHIRRPVLEPLERSDHYPELLPGLEIFERPVEGFAGGPQHLGGEQGDRAIQRGFEQGYFLMVGSLQPNRGGGIIAHGASLEKLEGFVAEDPFVAEGVVTAEILEISPARADQRLDFLMG